MGGRLDRKPAMYRDPLISSSGQPSDELDRATSTYAEHREMLFAVVYNMLGTVADTEDVLQDTWLSWATTSREGVINARTYLLRIAVNGALARLRAARRARETYVGPWLPEPLITSDDATVGEVVLAESVSFALMVVLETLTPLERAVFVLREVFGYEHSEIGALLGRTPAAVRQLAHRARENIHARRPRYRPDPRMQRTATRRFLTAAVGGDIATLIEILAPDVTLYTDGGGKRHAALRVVNGRDKVIRLVAARSPHANDVALRFHDANGEPAGLAFIGGSVYCVVFVGLGPVGNRIDTIYVVLNPDKLARKLR